MSELKACPFCGQEAEINDWWRSESGTVYYVRCTGEVKGTGCRISTGAYRTPEEAKQAWNTRPLESALLSRAEKAENALHEIMDLARTGLPPSDMEDGVWKSHKLNRIASIAASIVER